MFIHQREPKPRRRPEIVHIPAGLRSWDPVVQGLPPVGDDLGPHRLLGGVPEAVGNLDRLQVQRPAESCLVHHVSTHLHALGTYP